MALTMLSSLLFSSLVLLLLLLKPSVAIYCDEDDCYDLLGVTQSANASEIKKAYYKLSLKHHPDKNPDPESKKLFVKIANAYEEFPYVRYCAAKSSLDASTMTTLSDLVPTKLAAGIWNCLARYKTAIPDFPQRETCELLIVDRSVDQIAPIIHEWTYDAMCHDLLNMEGNKYVHEVLSKSGTVEKREVLLEDHDPIWLELRHAHIADANERLHEKMTNFLSKNKAAQIHHDSRMLHAYQPQRLCGS